MNFNSLVWYSSLAIGDEKNSYVADFLNRSCELINEEINEEIKEKKLPINFKIDFLHIQKGEEGVGVLNNKLTPSSPFGMCKKSILKLIGSFFSFISSLISSLISSQLLLRKSAT